MAAGAAKLDVEMTSSMRLVEGETCARCAGGPHSGFQPGLLSLATPRSARQCGGTLRRPGRRGGVIRTDKVSRRTTALLLRLRFHLIATGRDGAEQPLLAEDVALVGFEGTPDDPTWLDERSIEQLLDASPSANVLAAA